MKDVLKYLTHYLDIKVKKILEIGLCLADTDLVETQILLKKYCQIQLFACDSVDFNRVKNRFQNLDYDLEKEYNFTLNDIRNTIYDANSFDFVYLISTLEHVGFDEFVNDKNNYGVFNRSEKFLIYCLHIQNVIKIL